MDSRLYNVVINMTLDCNLDCWYCYESKIPGSRINDETIQIIQKNIIHHYKEAPYRELKISFFGGEPLMQFEAIKKLLQFCKTFTEENHLELLADFTTNSTLLTDTQLEFLKDYRCQFQITFDGHAEKHNKIRFQKKDKQGTYHTILNNIYKIHDTLPNAEIWVRINYDHATLENMDTILDNIDKLDRRRCFLIMRKIWQFDTNKIDKHLILQALQKGLDRGFYIDSFTLPRTEPCFAERFNQVLFNYDGKVFKCSTLEHFDDEHAEGTVCRETGKIHWNVNSAAKKLMAPSPPRCIKCTLFPLCIGPCGKNAQRGDDFTCYIDNIGISKEEFIMFNYKAETVRKNIFN